MSLNFSITASTRWRNFMPVRLTNTARPGFPQVGPRKHPFAAVVADEHGSERRHLRPPSADLKRSRAKLGRPTVLLSPH